MLTPPDERADDLPAPAEAPLVSALPADFETALSELETVVASMESGDLSLESSLQSYRRGAQLLKFCRARLSEAAQQVKVLEGDTLQDYAGGDTVG